MQFRKMILNNLRISNKLIKLIYKYDIQEITIIA